MIKKFNVGYKLISLLLCTLTIINAQETEDPPRIVTLPGPNVEGIPATTKVGTYPDSDFTKLLSYSLYFYEAQRSGILPPNNRVPWRHNSALKDGEEGFDLTGGYYDAGDYIKFTLPLSWTLSMISWGGIEWFKGYELSGQEKYLHDMVKWGTDWLIKAHSLETNELCVEVGIDKIDHNYWGSDQNIPLPRPVFKVGDDVHGTDVAAETVAAFASSSILFKDKFGELDYAKLLLTHAKRLFEFAELKPMDVYSKQVPEAILYGARRYQDKLVWASLWLYRATGEQIYLNKARQYFVLFAMKGYMQIINWAEKTCATFILFAQLTNGTNFMDELTWKSESENYLDIMINPSLLPGNRCSYTPGGLLWCTGDSEFNSLNVALNIAFVSLIYAPYATTEEKKKKYKDFANFQIMYALGENPKKHNYVVGVNPKSPQNPHHAGAHGSVNNDLLSPVKTTNILYGALIGGPGVNDDFNDDRTQYNFTEVSLDYNAPWQGLMAYQVLNYIPTIPKPKPPTNEPKKSKDIPSSNNNNVSNNDTPIVSSGRKTGIIVGTSLGAIFLIIGGLFAWKHSTILKWFGKKREEIDKIVKRNNVGNNRRNSSSIHAESNLPHHIP
ncbi:6695_t:CDS:2 [Funneliformis geosporum]|uniref:Endoglucanase n=1 Tax=Funneliformis geosporum TaxID=1117311 RepID=A0A9W4SJ08_9GLOM|nr:17546_t:CDS:2 [Funneliformis geosporum]CAI2174202.1 6695_t:CDS:2 [Funneliformis geosporum]